MALIIEIENETGATAKYWKVIAVDMNFFAGVGMISLAGYVTKAARNAGKKPLEVRQFPVQNWAFEEFQRALLDGTTLTRAAYKFIKGYAPPEGSNPFTAATSDDT